MQKDASLALTVKSESRVELETPWGRANKYNASCGAMKLHVCMCNDERLLHIMQNPFIHIHTYMYIIHSIYSPSPCIKKDTSIVGLWWYSPICLFTLCTYLLIFYRNRNALVTPRFFLWRSLICHKYSWTLLRCYLEYKRHIFGSFLAYYKWFCITFPALHCTNKCSIYKTFFCVNFKIFFKISYL